MPFFPDVIEFIVSENDKAGNPKRPDYRGEVKFCGQTYEFAGWKRTKQGTTRQFVSGRLTRKQDATESDAPRHEEAPKQGRSQPDRAPNSANLDEDVPF